MAFKYTLEEAQRLRDVLKQNPSAAQYYSRTHFMVAACTTQKELDLVKEYMEAKQGLASTNWYRVGANAQNIVDTYNSKMSEIESQISDIINYAEKKVEETYWTEGGAGYEPEETVAQPTVNIEGQEYYWTGTSYVPAGTAMTVPEGTTAPIADTTQATGYTSADYSTAAYQAALQERASAVYQYALNYGMSEDEAISLATRELSGEDIYSTIPQGEYTPTLAGAGYPLAETGGTAATGQLVGEGDGWRLYESSGIKFPWQTPKGVGMIAADTAQAEVYYQNLLTGEWESTGKYIKLEGDQAQAGLAYLQTLSSTYGTGNLTTGYYPDPYTAAAAAAAAGEGYEVTYDTQTMTWRVDPVGGTSGVSSEFQQWYMEQQLALDQAAQALQEQQFAWEQAQAGVLTPYQEAQLELAYEQLEQDREMTEYQAEQLRLQEEYQNWQMAETERQYAAQLASEPINWLQYSAYTGEQPAIQPWMLPLESQAYGWTGQQAGEAIPGWTSESMTEMPQLLNPSAQYTARLSPSQLQQYYGYEQARTGQTPEDVEWRLWQYAPPSGNYSGLTWGR